MTDQLPKDWVRIQPSKPRLPGAIRIVSSIVLLGVAIQTNSVFLQILAVAPALWVTINQMRNES